MERCGEDFSTSAAAAFAAMLGFAIALLFAERATAAELLQFSQHNPQVESHQEVAKVQQVALKVSEE